jgi:hypothetical protein
MAKPTGFAFGEPDDGLRDERSGLFFCAALDGFACARNDETAHAQLIQGSSLPRLTRQSIHPEERWMAVSIPGMTRCGWRGRRIYSMTNIIANGKHAPWTTTLPPKSNTA